MKKILCLLLFSNIISLNIFAQAPSFMWAQACGGTGCTYMNNSCTDLNGNVYMIGSFGEDSIVFGNVTLFNRGNPSYTDIFIVKYDALGNVKWAKNPGGRLADYGSSICTDSIGNVFFTGGVQSDSSSFDNLLITKLDSPSTYVFLDFFVAKYDSLGNALWVKSAKGKTGDDEGSSIAVDRIGNVCIAGNFYSDTLSFGSTFLTRSSSYTSMFISKYDGAGNFMWAGTAGGDFGNNSTGISVDLHNNIYLCGFINTPGTSIVFGSVTLTLPGNIFIVKYDQNGTVAWAIKAGGIIFDAPSSICNDKFGNVLITGFGNSNPIVFDTITVPAGDDAFVAKYNSSGHILWVKNASVNSYYHGNGLVCDTNCNVYIAGDDYYGRIFFSRLDSSGNSNWEIDINGGGGNNQYYDKGNSINVSANGNVYVAGFFDSGTITFGNITLSLVGNYSFYIARLSGLLNTNELIDKSVFNLFPNPTKENIQLSFDQRIANGGELEIFDSKGSSVLQQQFLNPESQILNISSLPSGIYLLQVKCKEGVVSKKFVKE